MQIEPHAISDSSAFSRTHSDGAPTSSKTTAPARAPFVGVDLEGFHREIRDLRRELEEGLCEKDLEHLYKIERWGKIATGIGMATAWMGPNLISALGLGLGRSTRWILMHHVGHRGYDKVPGTPERYTSKGFARGRRRFLDWPDWMIPKRGFTSTIFCIIRIPAKLRILI